MKNLIEKMERHFKNELLTITEWQMNEPNVGLSEGWVVFTHDDSIWIMSWDDAVFHTSTNSTQSEILNDSEITEIFI